MAASCQGDTSAGWDAASAYSVLVPLSTLRPLFPARELHLRYYGDRPFGNCFPSATTSLSCILIYSTFTALQNCWGRDLLRWPSPPPCSKHCQLEQVAHDHVQLGFEYVHRQTLQNLPGQSMTVFHNPHSKQVFFLCLKGISCISMCAHCFLFCHWAPLRIICLHLLCSPPSGILHMGTISPSHLPAERPQVSQPLLYTIDTPVP